MSRFYFNWTPEVLDRCRRLANDGKTAKEISKLIGTTRNSVIGKFYRERIILLGRSKKYNIGARRMFDSEGNFKLSRN